jgi:hypothetical protein
MRARAMKQGVTLTELLIVIGVIVGLCGLAYPIYTALQRQAAIRSTKNLVCAVCARALSFKAEFVTGTDGNLWHAWMLGQFAVNMARLSTQIDGDPRLYPAGDPSPLASRAPPGYTGFLAMTGFAPPWPPNAKGQLVDRWRQPLNIDYNATRYPKQGIGVWSSGPDQVSQGGAAGSDDITSWSGSGDQ